MLINLSWLITCLKVFKASCYRLMNHLPLEVLVCLEVQPLDNDGSVLLSVVAQSLFYNFLCVGSPSLSSNDVNNGYQ
jgi:hypothetical protein